MRGLLGSETGGREKGDVRMAGQINIPIKRKYSRVARLRKPEWLECPKCHHIILLKPVVRR
jgi:hypothetical protein